MVTPGHPRPNLFMKGSGGGRLVKRNGKAGGPAGRGLEVRGRRASNGRAFQAS